MKDKINYKNLNEILGLSSKLLKLVYVFFIIAAVYIGFIACKEIGVWSFIAGILKVISPLFIGIILAWLFNPLVSKLEKKGIRRGLGALISYLLFIGIIVLLFWAVIPMLYNQIIELSNNIPAISDKVQIFVTDIFDKLDKIQVLDANAIELKLLKNLDKVATSLTNSLPQTVINCLKSIISGGGNFAVGMIIGFYLLLSYDNAIDLVVEALPRKLQSGGTKLAKSINNALRKYVKGALLDCTLVFVLSSIGFSIIGLKSSILLGLFCGVTNIIPYLGPYLGGAPAVIIGLSQNPITGILALAIIAVIQFVEGNFLQPIIMSKAVKLHPIVIMLGLLIFGHFFGIIGMILATPIVAVLKSIFEYFDEKYDILKFN